MTTYTTPILSLTLANPGTNEPFSTATVNANFEALDTDAGATDASLTANASSITSVGNRVTTIENNSAKGTVTQYTVASLAALDAISAAVVGDQAVFSAAPSTGISATDGLEAQAYSGSGASTKWHFTSQIVAATLANMDTFIAACVAITDLNTSFIVGQKFYVTATATTYLFTSTAGAYKVWESDWISWATAPTNLTVGTGGSASSMQRYKYIAGRVYFDYKFVLGSSGASMGTAPTLNLPITLARLTPTGGVITVGDGAVYDLSAVATTNYTKAVMQSATTVAIQTIASGVFANIASTAPITWAAGDILAGGFWGDLP